VTSPSQPTNRLTLVNVLHIAICAGMLVLFVIVTLQPLYQKYTELLQRGRLLKGQIATHAVLLPLHTELNTENGFRYLSHSKTTEHVPLSAREFAGIHAQVEKISNRCGLQLLNVSPRVSSLSDKRQFLGVNVMADGAFVDMQLFLNSLMQLPSFFYLEKVRISEGVGAEQIEALVWLSIE
jgi:hypothetical protein